MIENICWDNFELIIFDVDGTLYNQQKLRKTMFIKLVTYYALRPWRYRELRILYYFRKERDKRAGFAGDNLEQKQFEWCSEITGDSVSEIRRVVEHWIFTVPNPFLKDCAYPGVHNFLSELKNKGIKTAVYSDYRSDVKMKHLGLEVDLQLCSTDTVVNAFKPRPEGLNVIMTEFKTIDRENCLFVGDRYELDGRCAENAGVSFYLVDHQQASANLYHNLIKHFSK